MATVRQRARKLGERSLGGRIGAKFIPSRLRKLLHLRRLCSDAFVGLPTVRKYSPARRHQRPRSRARISSMVPSKKALAGKSSCCPSRIRRTPGGRPSSSHGSRAAVSRVLRRRRAGRRNSPAWRRVRRRAGRLRRRGPRPTAGRRPARTFGYRSVSIADRLAFQPARTRAPQVDAGVDLGRGDLARQVDDDVDRRQAPP